MAEFRQGWPALVAAFIGIAVGVSSLFFYTLGIFFRPLHAAFGWSLTTLSMGSLVSGLTFALVSPLVGRLVDRYGPRPVGGVSMLMVSCGFGLLSVIDGQLWQYFCALAVLCALGAGASPVVFTRLVSAKFERSRGLALGLSLTGAGLVGALAPALLAPYVAEHGWRMGYRLLALIVLAATPLTVLLAGSTPGRRFALAAQPGSGMSLGQARRDRRFWTLAAVFYLVATAVTGLVVHFVPMLLGAGLSPAAAGATAGLVGLSVIAGRVLSGALIDRVHAPYVASGLFLAAAAGCLLLATMGPSAAPVAAILVGCTLGAEVDMVGFFVARYFGMLAYGAIFGWLYAAFVSGAASGPLLMASLTDHFGSYHASLWTAAGLLVVAGMVAPTLGRYSIKITENAS